MTNKEVKLTISILASNRKDTLPKCLESLRPLLNQVPSELIITDTGCDEELLEYIRQYTDKIVKFQWCNDFAVARNVGLKMAKGQWFMYIDDDEWFEDVTELVEFFNSGEEKAYATASYVVRNYRTLLGDTYNESFAGRLFRIRPGLEFVGKIHEYVDYGTGKEKAFSAYVHHYGYVFIDDNKKMLHYERNISLLKEEISNEPGSARNYAHIYQEFKVMNRPLEALEYALEALECVVEETRENKLAMCSTYVCVLWACCTMGEYENVIKWGKEFLGNKPITGLAKASIVSYMIEAYNGLEQYDIGLKAVDEYVKLLDIYTFDKQRYYFELGPLLNVFVLSRCDEILSIGLEMAIKAGDIVSATEYIDAFQWDKDVHISNLDCLNGLIELIASVEVESQRKIYAACIKALGKLFTHIEASRIVIKAISDLKVKDSQGYDRVYGIMSNVAGQWGYNDLVKIISLNKKGDIDSLCDMYVNVINGERSILGMDKLLYHIAWDRKLPLNQMISSISIERWALLVSCWLEKMSNRELLIMKKYFDILLDKASIYMKVFDIELLKVLETRKNK